MKSLSTFVSRYGSHFFLVNVFSLVGWLLFLFHAPESLTEILRIHPRSPTSQFPPDTRSLSAKIRAVSLQSVTCPITAGPFFTLGEVQCYGCVVTAEFVTPNGNLATATYPGAKWLVRYSMIAPDCSARFPVGEEFSLLAREDYVKKWTVVESRAAIDGFPLQIVGALVGAGLVWIIGVLCVLTRAALAWCTRQLGKTLDSLLAAASRKGRRH